MKLIINADDFGLTAGINQAILELAGLGSISSTTVMVNMPFASDAVDATKIGGIGVGLHFNLTEGRPLSSPSDIPSIVDHSGAFLPYRTFVRKARLGLIPQKEILQELNRQFQALESILGQRPDHIDTHQNIHKEAAVAKAMIKFGNNNPSLSIRNPSRYYINQAKNGFSVMTATKGNGFEKVIKQKVKRLYFKWLQTKFEKAFKLPLGELHFHTHKKADFFNWLINEEVLIQTLGVFEVPCHPATTTKGITDSRLTDKRLKEYEILRSKAFVKSLEKIKLVNFQDI